MYIFNSSYNVIYWTWKTSKQSWEDGKHKSSNSYLKQTMWVLNSCYQEFIIIRGVCYYAITIVTTEVLSDHMIVLMFVHHVVLKGIRNSEAIQYLAWQENTEVPPKFEFTACIKEFLSFGQDSKYTDMRRMYKLSVHLCL